MKKIFTGKGYIPIVTLIAIWSISLVVDLPGLAITPIMGQLDRVFPHATHLEIQMLSVLPNFIVIPFILLSGHLSASKSKLTLICVGMLLFLLSGIAYFFARSMMALIIISCVLGIGCGLVIPLAAGVIADFFSGVERMRQMGIKSGIANFTLIIATLVVGWLGDANWHLPFLVYLVPVVPLCLAPFLTKKFLQRNQSVPVVSAPHPSAAKLAQEQAVADKARQKVKAVVEQKDPSAVATGNPVIKKKMQTMVHKAVETVATPLQRARASSGSRIRNITGIMIFYFIITISTIAITYYLPFVMQDYKMSDSDTSILTSVFFLFITVAGFILPYVVKFLKSFTSIVCLGLMIGGLILVALFHNMVLLLIAVTITGFGYGVLQPIFYNKASMLAPTSADSTKVISYIMSANYLGTAVTPLIFTGISNLFHIQGHAFTFWLGVGFLAVMLVVAVILARSFVFYTSLKEC